jgi:hypothetical protein
MATAKQIQANRRNAQNSTGPRSAASKEKVSQNRLSHGLCGPFRVLAYESQDQFENLIAQLTADQKPAGPLESELIRKMAEAMWTRNRAVQLQTSCFTSEHNLPHPGEDQVEVEVDINHDINLYMRYEAHHDRLFRRALADLLKLQKERRLREIGFERQQREKAAEARREKQEIRREKLDNIRFLDACLAYQTKKQKVEALQSSQGQPLNGNS